MVSRGLWLADGRGEEQGVEGDGLADRVVLVAAVVGPVNARQVCLPRLGRGGYLGVERGEGPHANPPGMAFCGTKRIGLVCPFPANAQGLQLGAKLTNVQGRYCSGSTPTQEGRGLITLFTRGIYPCHMAWPRKRGLCLFAKTPLRVCTLPIANNNVQGLD